MQSITMSKLKQVLSFESVIIITQNGMCLLFIITWPEGAFLEKYLIQNQIAREQTKTIYGTSHFVFIADIMSHFWVLQNVCGHTTMWMTLKCLF